MRDFKMYTFYAPLLLEYKIYRDNPGRYPDGSLDNDEDDPRTQKGRILMGDKRITVRERSIEDAIKKVKEDINNHPVPPIEEVIEVISAPDDGNEWFLEEESFRWIPEVRRYSPRIL